MAPAHVAALLYQGPLFLFSSTHWLSFLAIICPPLLILNFSY
jgi:hypothetical protein